MANQSEQRYSDPEEIALNFGHVEGRIDDLEVGLIRALETIVEAETVEERREALDELCEMMPTMKVHRGR